MKILLLEDDLILNEIIDEFLHTLGYEVDTVYNGLEAQELAYEKLYDLLILDVNVPGLTGFEFLKSLRENQINTPAIFITSLDSLDDIQEGFDSGCDDYIKKPFELKELELRINNLKRHFHINTDEITLKKGIAFKKSELRLTIDGEAMQIPQKEAKILSYFHQNMNRTISHEELISNIWTYEETPSPSTIRTYIKNLRKLLGEESIETIKGVGYRFNI